MDGDGVLKYLAVRISFFEQKGSQYLLMVASGTVVQFTAAFRPLIMPFGRANWFETNGEIS